MAGAEWNNKNFFGCSLKKILRIKGVQHTVDLLRSVCGFVSLILFNWVGTPKGRKKTEQQSHKNSEVRNSKCVGSMGEAQIDCWYRPLFTAIVAARAVINQ